MFSMIDRDLLQKAYRECDNLAGTMPGEIARQAVGAQVALAGLLKAISEYLQKGGD